jgi:hypothetical protein
MKPKNIVKVGNITEKDYIKAMRKADRESEMDTFGPGFHSKTKIHKSQKTYSRKNEKMKFKLYA